MFDLDDFQDVVIAAVLFLFFVLAIFYFNNKGYEQETVAELDVERYMGVWYEVASLPAWFQRDLVNVTATYSLNPDGTVSVVNQGVNKNTGEVKVASAIAKMPAPEDPGKLKVYFNKWIGGDYFILELDEQYEYVLVGSASKRYLWILSREPFLDQTIYDGLIESAKLKGYNVEKINKVV